MHSVAYNLDGSQTVAVEPRGEKQLGFEHLWVLRTTEQGDGFMKLLSTREFPELRFNFFL